MKRFLAMLMLILVLSGCAKTNTEMDRAIALRERLLKCNGCAFDAVITADYGDKIYTFTLRCQMDSVGNLVFEVSDPESIAGIKGQISEEGGKLTFTDTILAFETMVDGQITPVTTPWILMHTLRSGYMNTCGKENDGLRIGIDDSYEDDALHLDIWTDRNDYPLRGEIIWQGRRILAVDVRNFAFV